jgi:hypothetical protein
MDVSIAPNAAGHHDLLERGIAGALADTVDRALDLPDASLDGGDAVRDRKPQIVVTMRAEDRLVRVRHAAPNLLEELPGIFRCAVADGIRQVDGRRPLANRALDNAAEEIAIAARRILCRKLHIVGVLPGAPHAADNLLEAGLARDAQLALQVQIRGRQKRMDPPAFRRFQRAGRFVDVDLAAARQGGDDRAADGGRDLPRRFRVGGRSNWKPRLDDVHTQRVQRTREPQLGGHVHRKAGRLLAIPQSGIEQDDMGGILDHAGQCRRLKN